VATFSNCGLTGVIGSYTLIASSPGLSSVTSAAITLTIGAASQLVFQTQPAGTVDGITFGLDPWLLWKILAQHRDLELKQHRDLGNRHPAGHRDPHL